MEFNQFISDRLGLIFQKHNLHIIEQFKNHVKLKSDRVFITLNHDERENSNAFYIGSNEDFLYPVDEYVLKRAFNSDLKISNLTQEMFINNLAVFFEGEGNPLIAGNTYALEAVEKYVYKEGKAYTTQLVDKQNLDAADKAWEEKKYKEFIKYLDKTDKQKLPSSYELKYKMAHQKLKL
jgi:hypothetical protein